MLEHFNKVNVSRFDALSDEELLEEKDKAYAQYQYIQSCREGTPYHLASMMGKTEWYIGKIMEEMQDRGIDGGFKFTKGRSVKIIGKRQRISRYLLLPKI